MADWLEKTWETSRIELFAPETIENSGPLACVLHGDYWGNNMLFKYEDTDNPTKPTAVKMVDFQIARIGHPVTDLLYYFYTSTLPEVRKEHLTSWLSFYFNTLMMYLKKLEIDIADYNLDDFMVDYKKRSITWMIMGISIMMIALDKEALSNMDNVAKFMQENPDSGIFRLLSFVEVLRLIEKSVNICLIKVTYSTIDRILLNCDYCHLVWWV